MSESHKHTSDLIWSIANLLRGPYRPPQYRRVMIPLTVLRRLDCVLEGKLDAVIKLHGKLLAEGKYESEALERVVNQRLKLHFHNTSGFTFQKLLGDPDKLAANLLKYIAGFSGTARRILEKFKFDADLSAAFATAELGLEAGLKTALLAPGALGERDPTAEVCWNRKGESEPDAELRDTENVPLPPGIALPLPLDCEGKKNKGKIDIEPLLNLVQAHRDAYLAAEVLPYRDDAWVDHSKTKVGCEIPFNRHFYEYEPPRPLQAIEADIEALERDIMALLKEVTA